MFGLELPTHFTYTITAAATIPTATSTIVTINIATIILLWHSQNYHCDPCGCYCHHHYHNFPVMTAMPEMAMPLMWVPPFLCSFCLVPSVYYLCMLVRLSPIFFSYLYHFLCAYLKKISPSTRTTAATTIILTLTFPPLLVPGSPSFPSLAP